MSDEAKAFRLGQATAIMKLMTPHMVFDPGMGKPPMKFKHGALEELRTRLQVFVDTGKLPAKESKP